MRNTGSNTIDHKNIFTMKSKGTKRSISKNQSDSIYLGTMNESPKGHKITGTVSTDRYTHAKKVRDEEEKDRIIAEL